MLVGGVCILLMNVAGLGPARPGSVLGLLGTNGAGKTTMIKCALGLIRPQAGEARLLGEPSWTLSAEAKMQIGYVPQVINLYPWMKVRHLLDYTSAFYPNWNHDLSARLSRVDYILLGKATFSFRRHPLASGNFSIPNHSLLASRSPPPAIRSR